MIGQRLVLIATFVIGTFASGGAATAAGITFTQSPCVTAGSGPCKDFGPSTIPATIREIQINAPSAGKAAVSFTGSMFCINNSRTISGVVDFVTQIVPASGAVPNLAGPSALRHAARLAPSFNGTTRTFSFTFNLASTRVFTISTPGTKSYFFKIDALLMNADMRCIVYDAAFTVVFLPDPALIVTQPSCTTAGTGPCKTFNEDSVLPTIRSITFDAPAAGKAAVSFTGSMFCWRDAVPGATTFTTLITQITANAADVPAFGGAGALAHSFSFGPPFDGEVELASATFSLASTRVFSIAAAGTRRFHFNLNNHDMAVEGHVCAVYDASFSIVFTPTAAPQRIVTQAPCTIDTCPAFDSEDVPATLRSITFDPPGRGRAAVSFTGSLSCYNTTFDGFTKVVDLVTQIVPGSAASPSVVGPGALRHAIRLAAATAPSSVDPNLIQTSFNLASTRVFPIGSDTPPMQFSFNLAALRIDAGAECWVEDAAFTIMFNR